MDFPENIPHPYVQPFSLPKREDYQGVTVHPITADEASYAVHTEKEPHSLIRSVYRKVVSTLFSIASLLTDPICKTREYFYKIYVVDSLHPDNTLVNKYVRKVIYFFISIFFAGIAAITTIPALFIRFLAICIQWTPYSYEPGEAKEIEGKSNISILSWNICCVPGGYSITDGGVTPWSNRIHRIIDKIQREDPDLICLYEVFDYDAATTLKEAFKENYAHFYFNIGPRTIGASSGLFIASKVPVNNPEFLSFPNKMKVGRTKLSEKGIFSFDTPQTRIYTTHLQHSEIPSSPTREEYKARKAQVDILVKKVTEHREIFPNILQVVTGDLNVDEKEFEAILASHFYWERTKEKSWGGDRFCSELMKKNISYPLNLDYTLLVKNTLAEIESRSIDAEYTPNLYRESDLSDHNGLISNLVFLSGS